MFGNDGAAGCSRFRQRCRQNTVSGFLFMCWRGIGHFFPSRDLAVLLPVQIDSDCTGTSCRGSGELRQSYYENNAHIVMRSLLPQSITNRGYVLKIRKQFATI